MNKEYFVDFHGWIVVNARNSKEAQKIFWKWFEKVEVMKYKPLVHAPYCTCDDVEIKVDDE